VSDLPDDVDPVLVSLPRPEDIPSDALTDHDLPRPYRQLRTPEGEASDDHRSMFNNFI
jgi:hypothetical protein